jgi:hypothetical protein
VVVEEEPIQVKEAEVTQKVVPVALEVVHGMLAQLAVLVILLQLLLVKEIMVEALQAEEANTPTPALGAVVQEHKDLLEVVLLAPAVQDHNHQ